jgi:outer membrane protein
MKIMKKLFVCFFVFAAALLSAQNTPQLMTRFAIVDMPKIYLAFFRDSRAVREFEERSASVQAEIEKRTREIQELKSRHAAAVSEGNREQAQRLDSEIYSKSESLKEYYTTKTAELEDQKRKLSQSGTFLDQVHNEIRSIAETEGYSMVVDKESSGIVWYSPAVDITDKVIQSLSNKSRR